MLEFFLMQKELSKEQPPLQWPLKFVQMYSSELLAAQCFPTHHCRLAIQCQIFNFNLDSFEASSHWNRPEDLAATHIFVLLYTYLNISQRIKMTYTE